MWHLNGKLNRSIDELFAAKTILFKFKNYCLTNKLELNGNFRADTALTKILNSLAHDRIMIFGIGSECSFRDTLWRQ